MTDANQVPPIPPTPPTPPVPPTPPTPNGEDIIQMKATIADLQDKLKSLAPFVEDASILISAVYQDPQLKESVKAAIQKNFGGQDPNNPKPPDPNNPGGTMPPSNDPNNPTPPTPPAPVVPAIDPMLNNVDLQMRNDLIAKVENSLGYSNMSPDEKKTLRQTVEKKLNGWGVSVMTAPVTQLSALLKDAYLISDLGKAKEQGRVEALIDSHQNEQGAFPAMGSSTPAEAAAVMTPHHETWSKKLGVDADKVAANLKEFTETGRISYKPPEVANPNPTPAPSGTPTPPAPQA